LDQPERRREDDWFLENERQLLEEARQRRQKREVERAAKERAEERERLKALHFMKCPKCGHDLEEVRLEGVTVDRCATCEGVFFDAGELDQLLLKKAEERRGFFRRLAGL
jgi:hypothetical protein